MENIDFSIIVPFYNKEKTLEACIQSLLAQEYPAGKYEIICVNNNSTDSSCLVVNRYPAIKLIHEKKQGAYAARNAGILESKGALIVFTDADVEVRKNWLSSINLAISKNGYDILIGWYNAAISGRLSHLHSRSISARIIKALEQKNMFMLTASACNLVVKKEIFEKEGLFLDIPRSEDTYFVMRCLKQGYSVGFAEDIEVRRNDIYSVNKTLLKNFIYGYANALWIKQKTSLPEKVKVVSITIKFVFKHFPLGIGLLLFTFSYAAGYFLGKSKYYLRIVCLSLFHFIKIGEL